MANITDFFGKAKKTSDDRRSRPSSSRSSTSAAGKGRPEIINLDDSEHETKMSKEEKQKTPVQGMKESSKSKSVTAHDVLAQIPSVDLSRVHVKENVQFDFRNNGGSNDDDASMGNADDFPKGKPNCLLGLTIVFTGTLPTIERGAAESLAKAYGARVTKSISNKTSVVVLGEEAGPKKVDRIKELHIKAINEDGFKQLIQGMPTGGGSGVSAEKARRKLEEQEEEAQREADEIAKREDDKVRRVHALEKSHKHIDEADLANEKNQLWTVKYAPTNLQQICGNKSAVSKLKNWLVHFDENRKLGFKRPGKDGSGIFRAAMLYGPPGIGKTTAAHLVAQELGYDILAKNASDVRSKTLLNADVKNALDNMSVMGFLENKHMDQDTNNGNGKKFVVIMDEVDGMSGGDRGGIGQLAQFCRKTLTPIILICNERNIPKMRPFDRTCFDIQFRRPDANSIKARLMTIALREHFKLDPNIVDRLVQSTRGDVRQIINLLSTVSKTKKTINHENITEISQAWQKEIALKPFDIAHKLLEGHIYTDAGSQSFTLNDKISLYFDDIDFTPLMIQENYVNTRPSLLQNGETHLDAVAKASDSISLSNLVEARIRSSEQLWSLLPLHAVLSSIYPASKVAGHMAGRINFTTWLGQNSRTNKYYRLLQELQYHTRLSTSTNKFGLRLEYLPALKKRLLDPISKEGSEGIDAVIKVMDYYYLTKDDWDAIMDFLVGPASPESVLKKIPTPVKTAFTRKYNSTTHPVAIYRTGTTTMASSVAVDQKPDFEDIIDADDAVPPQENDEPDEDTDLKKDKLIKQKARPSKRKATKSGSTRESGSKRRRTKSKT